MLFSYIVGHVPVNFRKRCLKMRKLLRKGKVFFYTPFNFLHVASKTMLSIQPVINF